MSLLMYGMGALRESVFVVVIVHVGQISNPNPSAMSVLEPGGTGVTGCPRWSAMLSLWQVSTMKWITQ